MRYFFFGSLMDADILALVLGRAVPASATRPASLHGYQRFRVRGESFPMLQPAPGGRVEGILVEALDEADAARIAWFEDRDYEMRDLEVVRNDGQVVTARVWLATERLAHDGEAWELSAWQAAEKASFATLAGEWMALHGCLEEPRQRTAWADLKSRLEGPARRAARAR